VYDRIRECDLLVGRQQARAMVGMDMGDDDIIDVGGIYASGGEALRQAA
jgi:hypothetical protein